MNRIAFIVILVFHFTTSLAQQTDELYLNYATAIKKGYFLVVKIKNLNTGETREICTKGNLFEGALHREYGIGYDSIERKKVKDIALENKTRCFEFKNDSAINNMSPQEYTMNNLSELEKQINFDKLAKKIKKKKKWTSKMLSDSEIKMFAHALFNRGILTWESNCWGGKLYYVDRNDEK